MDQYRIEQKSCSLNFSIWIRDSYIVRGLNLVQFSSSYKAPLAVVLISCQLIMVPPQCRQFEPLLLEASLQFQHPHLRLHLQPASLVERERRYVKVIRCERETGCCFQKSKNLTTRSFLPRVPIFLHKVRLKASILLLQPHKK